jgi:hypothetical protein
MSGLARLAGGASRGESEGRLVYTDPTGILDPALRRPSVSTAG